jgi:hypothetical protein
MNKKLLLSLLLLVQVIIVNLLSFFPDFIENYYSNGLYPYIARTSRLIFGFSGFSVGDIIYGAVLFLIIKWLWKNRKTWRRNYKAKMDIDKKYTPDELVAFTKKLIAKTNSLQETITGNDSLKVKNPAQKSEIYTIAINGYQNLEKQYPQFNYENLSVKSSLISTPLSYMGFGGYLNPFTNEAQVNSKLPKYNYPTTTCHEMAHQIGYASESEANFIGYMASISNNDIYFQYSGYSFALKYCLRNISKIDEEQAKSLLPLINKGVRLNFKESEEFNDEYQSFIENIFKYFYDSYLKLNHQEEGLETYSKFVGLLVNYYKDKEL